LTLDPRKLPPGGDLRQQMKYLRECWSKLRVYLIKGERQRVEHSFATLLKLAGIEGFRFHDLRYTFASWYMMHGGDLYELAKILGHSNIK